MYRKVLGIVEDRAQGASGLRVLIRTVQLAVQVGGGEMRAAVRGIGRRTDGRRVRGPHRRRRISACENRRRFLECTGDHIRVAAAKTDAAQQPEIRPDLGRQ